MSNFLKISNLNKKYLRYFLNFIRLLILIQTYPTFPYIVAKWFQPRDLSHSFRKPHFYQKLAKFWSGTCKNNISLLQQKINRLVFTGIEKHFSSSIPAYIANKLYFFRISSLLVISQDFLTKSEFSNQNENFVQ